MKWEYDYLHYLLKFTDTWINHVGPGGIGKWQRKINENTTESPKAPFVNGTGKQQIGMFTTDVSLFHDSKYLEIVKQFNESRPNFDMAFKHAWYKLTTRDMVQDPVVSTKMLPHHNHDSLYYPNLHQIRQIMMTRRRN